jgi:glycosidase
MDFVPSHTSERHPYFIDAEEKGTASQYYDYYQRDEGGNYTYYFGYNHLPNLNYDNQEVKNLIAEAMTYWVREFGIDGYRVDFAWAIRERRPDFWPAMNAELTRVKPDILMLAEAGARDPYYVENGFSSAYDWTEELGHWAWGDALGSVAPIDQAMTEVLTNGGEGYPPDSLVFRFLNNNDTGARLISSYGVDFYRVAAAMLLTMHGLPCVYTGDESGAEFDPYGQTTPIDWTDQHDLRPYVKQLIGLRRSVPTLHSREWVPVAVAPAGLSFGYVRPGEPGTGNGSSVLVLLNFGAPPLDATVTLPAE